MVKVKNIYKVVWFDGIKETKEVYTGEDKEYMNYIEANAEEWETDDIYSLFVYENKNGGTCSVKYASIDDLADSAMELAYPSEDIDEMIDKLWIRVTPQYVDYVRDNEEVAKYLEKLVEAVRERLLKVEER